MKNQKLTVVATELLDCYKKLHDLSKQQTQFYLKQIQKDVQRLMQDRDALFARIEKLQEEFLVAESEYVESANQTHDPELHEIKKSVQMAIDQIVKSDQNLHLLLEERKRQIHDKLLHFNHLQQAGSQYKKISENVRQGYFFSDQSRFYDEKK